MVNSIQSIHVKTPDSIALPIFNCLPPGPTVIDITSQPSVATKRSRPKDDDDTASDIDVSTQTEEVLPMKKKMKKTKLSTKRVRGSIVVKKLPTRTRKKR